MLIQVRWSNKLYDYVDASQLDNLIENDWVTSFQRSSGWVTVGVDPVRSRRANRHYDGIERRSSLEFEDHPLFSYDWEQQFLT